MKSSRASFLRRALTELGLLFAAFVTGCADKQDRAEITKKFEFVRSAVDSGQYQEVLVACPPGTQRQVVDGLRLEIKKWIDALPEANRLKSESALEAVLAKHRVKDLRFLPPGKSFDALYADVPDTALLFVDLWKFAVSEPRLAPTDWPVPAGQFAVRSLEGDLAVGVIQHPHSSGSGHRCEFIFRRVSGRWYFSLL